MSFSSPALSAKLLRAVPDKGYSDPTPIKPKATPAVLAGRDVGRNQGRTASRRARLDPEAGLAEGRDRLRLHRLDAAQRRRPGGAGHSAGRAEKAAEQGLLAGSEENAPPRRNPLLALRWKVLFTDPAVTRRITAPFQWLFRSWVLYPVLAGFAAVFSGVEQGRARSHR